MADLSGASCFVSCNSPSINYQDYKPCYQSNDSSNGLRLKRKNFPNFQSGQKITLISFFDHYCYDSVTRFHGVCRLERAFFPSLLDLSIIEFIVKIMMAR
jgi:hypothetical protein